ncbi:hypothetical protein Vafri_12277 [Volvox africanus]|uniref:Uncharacterized protein n=1 Tax=Volvox africanus TaxID=51714 RepID=A0A8J4B9N9_9CHLO|nr:hypothetical protein Vafri_12277 [Volvox africanus]
MGPKCPRRALQRGESVVVVHSSTMCVRKHAISLSRGLCGSQLLELNQNVELITFKEDKPSTARACWFIITRRCRSSDEMCAGKILGIDCYRSPLEKGRFDVVLEVEWHASLVSEHEAGVAIDRYMNVPLVDVRPASSANTGSHFYLAADIAPCHVHVLPHPSKHGALCVLSRSFTFMRVAGWEPLHPQTPWTMACAC